MTQAPSIKEALEAARQFIENGVELGYIKMPDADTPDPAHKTLEKIKSALANFQPDGEQREAIARIIDPEAYETISEARWEGLARLESQADAQLCAERKASRILASGLVQDEAGWRDISTAPKDGTLVDVWSEDHGRLTGARYLSSEYTDGVPWGWSSPWRGRITDALEASTCTAHPLRPQRGC